MIRSKFLVAALLCVLQAGDFVSTRLALRHGAVELNPLVRALGLWEAKLLAFAVVILLVIFARRARLLWTVAVVYTCIVGSNLLLLLRHGR